MTPITRKLVQETKCAFRGDPIVIELHATTVFVRTKGSRESFPITYTDLYEIAAMRDTKTQNRFRRQAAQLALRGTRMAKTTDGSLQPMPRRTAGTTESLSRQTCISTLRLTLPKRLMRIWSGWHRRGPARVERRKEGCDVSLEEAGIDVLALSRGRLYPERNIDGGLEAFSIDVALRRAKRSALITAYGEPAPIFDAWTLKTPGTRHSSRICYFKSLKM
jgi:hypothetical protein